MMIKEVRKYASKELGKDYNDALKLLSKMLKCSYSEFRKDYEELASTGVEAILNYLAAYSKVKRNCSFNTYIFLRLRQTLARHLNKISFGMSFPTRLKYWELPLKVVQYPTMESDDDDDYNSAIGDDWENVQKVDRKIYLDEKMNVVKSALNRLLPKDRSMILLRYGIGSKELGRKELCDIYNLSDAAVKERLRRSLIKIRKYINSNDKYRELF